MSALNPDVNLNTGLLSGCCEVTAGHTCSCFTELRNRNDPEIKFQNPAELRKLKLPVSNCTPVRCFTPQKLLSRVKFHLN